MDEEKIEELREELGDLAKDLSDEDLGDEEKVAELRTQKEDADKAKGNIKEGDLTDDERAELEKLKEKDLNFKKLRDSTKEEKEKIKKGKEELAKEQQEFREKTVQERLDDALDIEVGDDEELRKKTVFNFGRIEGDAVTRKEIHQKVKEAVGMTGTPPSPSMLARGGSHSGYRGLGETDKKETNESKEMRKDMRISDKDKEKYGGAEWQPTIQPKSKE